MTRTKINVRPIKESEIDKAAVFLKENKMFGLGQIQDQDIERRLTAQFHKQKSLVLAALGGDGAKIVGLIVGGGQGDTVSVERVAAEGENKNAVIKKLLTQEEKSARKYGYTKIFTTAGDLQRNFLISLGYKPRMLFTFFERRPEIFALFSELYPMWIEAGGQKVKVLLGGDHLESEVKKQMENLPIKTELLFVKNL